MKTMTTLPDVSDRRYGALSIGYDKITEIRGEMAALMALASLVIGKPAEELTVQDVQAMTRKLEEQQAAVEDPA